MKSPRKQETTVKSIVIQKQVTKLAKIDEIKQNDSQDFYRSRSVKNVDASTLSILEGNSPNLAPRISNLNIVQSRNLMPIHVLPTQIVERKREENLKYSIKSTLTSKKTKFKKYVDRFESKKESNFLQATGSTL